MSHPAPDREHVDQGPPPSFGQAGLTPPDMRDTEAVAAWLRWHAVELVSVGVPLALALAVSGWFVALVVPAAGLWAVNETRQARNRLDTGTERGALTSSNSTNGTAGEENDPR